MASAVAEICRKERKVMDFFKSASLALTISLATLPLTQIIYLVTLVPSVQIAFDCNKLPSEFVPHKWLLNRDLEWSDDVLIVTRRMY